jgi:hypothetical protein
MARWIDVPYKCRCMTAEVAIPVVERNAAENIVDFVTRVQYAVSDDHKKRLPLCAYDTMEYVKIPADGDVVGRAKGGVQ